MGEFSSEKGKRFEREAAAKLREKGLPGMRTAQILGKGGLADVIGLPGYHIECKHHERMRLYEWMKQAIRDSEHDGNIPVIIHKQNRKPILVTLLLTDFLDMVNDKNSMQ